MHILVLNPGSSSIKFSMFAHERQQFRSLYQGELSGVGTSEAALQFRDASGKDLRGSADCVNAASMEQAMDQVGRAVTSAKVPLVDAVGYRVVHPGPHLRGHQPVTPDVLARLREAAPFAPLHNPKDVQMIEEMQRRLPSVPHFVCFDTVFHETMAVEATTYALPQHVREAGVHRYGFHGLSCESIVTRMREAGTLPQVLMIAHLGSGCSITACAHGKSIDNTMGLTPTGGVVMGTRPGDLDPGILLYLLRQPGATADSIEAMVNHDSGLRALSGINDMRELRRRAAAGDPEAALAIAIFCRTVVKAIAGFTALYGADSIVFTGGIGEHDAVTRAEIAAPLARFGLHLDFAANQGRTDFVQRITAAHSTITAFVVPAEEDLMIAKHVARMCRASLN
jgi:acetate kinase